METKKIYIIKSLKNDIKRIMAPLSSEVLKLGQYVNARLDEIALTDPDIAFLQQVAGATVDYIGGRLPSSLPQLNPLDAPISALGLSTRAKNMFANGGVRRIDQLLYFRDDQESLRVVRNVGDVCLAETMTALDKYMEEVLSRDNTREQVQTRLEQMDRFRSFPLLSARLKEALAMDWGVTTLGKFMMISDYKLVNPDFWRSGYTYVNEPENQQEIKDARNFLLLTAFCNS